MAGITIVFWKWRAKKIRAKKGGGCYLFCTCEQVTGIAGRDPPYPYPTPEYSSKSQSVVRCHLIPKYPTFGESSVPTYYFTRPFELGYWTLGVNPWGVGNGLKWHASKIGRKSSKKVPKKIQDLELIQNSHRTTRPYQMYISTTTNQPIGMGNHPPLQLRNGKHANKSQEHPTPI